MENSGTAFKPGRIRLRQPGKLAKTTYANEIAAKLNSLSPPYVTGGVGVEREPPFTFLAKVVTAGPDGEANFNNEMYWLEPQAIQENLVTFPVAFNDDHSLTPKTIIPATNLHEQPATGGTFSHTLQAGTKVRVFAEIDQSPIPKVRYVFHRERPNTLFAVDLTQVGGLAGSPTAFSTFSYSIKIKGTSTVLGTGQPENSRARAFKCKVVAADKGAAYYDDGGGLILYSANETTVLCSYTIITSVVCNGDGTISTMSDTIYAVGTAC